MGASRRCQHRTCAIVTMGSIFAYNWCQYDELSTEKPRSETHKAPNEKEVEGFVTGSEKQSSTFGSEVFYDEDTPTDPPIPMDANDSTSTDYPVETQGFYKTFVAAVENVEGLGKGH